MIARGVRVGFAAVLAVALFGSVGCKWLRGGDAEEAEASSATASAAATAPPGPATVAQDPVPGGSAAPSAAPSAAVAVDPAPNPADTGAPVPPPITKDPVAPVRRESIDACCSALAAYKFSGRPTGVRNKAVRAAGVCRNIADTVRSGRSTRAAGLAQVRALAGGAAPPECN